MALYKLVSYYCYYHIITIIIIIIIIIINPVENTKGVQEIIYIFNFSAFWLPGIRSGTNLSLPTFSSIAHYY